ncbi:MAG: hypothetical protein Q9167_003057 [Letrouitia subvulpina]
MGEYTLFIMGLNLIIFYSLSLLITFIVISWIDRSRPSSNRSLWDNWRFSHTLSQFLALGGIFETTLVAISFYFVARNAYRVCEESLWPAQCSKKATEWQVISVFLGVIGLFILYVLLCAVKNLIKSYDSYRSAAERITYNRPSYLINGHVLLQLSAMCILFSAFSKYLKPDRNDVEGELELTMLMGTFSIIFYNIGVALNLFGTVNTHLIMRTIRREAVARNFHQAALIIWFRPVNDDAEDQIRRLLRSLRDPLGPQV